jgi:phosphatidylethanolamine-binding protein (PEBP) family uncharacterized protein
LFLLEGAVNTMSETKQSMNEAKPKLHKFLHGYKGYLTKQGKVFKQWSSRYFILEKKRLKYYEDDTLETCLGEMIVDSTVHLYDISEEVDGLKHLIYVVGKAVNSTEENLFLAASCDKEKQDWIEAITDSVHDGFKQIFQPDLWSSDFYPSVDVGIYYKKYGVAAENGNILRPSNTDVPPEVVFKGIHAEDRYSFIMLDIDPISSIENPSNKFFLHWGVINISGLDLKTGEHLAPYIPPAPVYNSGLHRFFFLVFKQRTSVSSIVLNEITELFHKRDGFPFMKWVRLMDFSDPAGINGFYSGWEEYCDTLHVSLSYIPPETFRSPNQENNIKKEEGRKRIEQGMSDLYRDLALRDVLGEQLVPSTAIIGSPISLQIYFHSNSSFSSSSSALDLVKDGQIIFPSVASATPCISFEDYSSVHNYYSLVLTDPDFPSRVNPLQREIVHWVVVNIPSNKIDEGTTVLSYLPPCPPFSSGLHRYVFCLFRQTRILSEVEIVKSKEYFHGRMGIRSYEWVKAMDDALMSSPIGLEAFISEWDESVDKTHEELGCWIPQLPYRSRKQTAKLNIIAEDEEDIETMRETRVAELEYELKTSVLQTVAQLKSAPLVDPSPFAEVTKNNIGKPSNEKEDSPVPFALMKGKGNRSVAVAEELVKEVAETFSLSTPSKVSPDSAIGISSKEWAERQHIEKAPLHRQYGLNDRSFKADDGVQDLVHTKSFLSEELSSDRASTSLQCLDMLDLSQNSSSPSKQSSPVKPSVKTITISSNDDLDALFVTTPNDREKSDEVENYDDDDGNDNLSSFKELSEATVGPDISVKSSGNQESPDHRSTPGSLFKRISLFKAQSQYISNEETTAVVKPKKLAASSSMYYKPTNTEDLSSKGKRLSQSASMYYKPFDAKAQEFKAKIDDNNAEVLAKCVTYDISSATVFEGGKSFFQLLLLLLLFSLQKL